MTTIPADLKLKYALNYKNGPNGPEPDKFRDVIFAEPRNTFTLPTGGADGTKDQEYVRVLNPDINQGRIRYPFESEFQVVDPPKAIAEVTRVEFMDEAK